MQGNHSEWLQISSCAKLDDGSRDNHHSPQMSVILSLPGLVYSLNVDYMKCKVGMCTVNVFHVYGRSGLPLSAAVPTPKPSKRPILAQNLHPASALPAPLSFSLPSLRTGGGGGIWVCPEAVAAGCVFSTTPVWEPAFCSLPATFLFTLRRGQSSRLCNLYRSTSLLPFS